MILARDRGRQPSSGERERTHIFISLDPRGKSSLTVEVLIPADQHGKEPNDLALHEDPVFCKTIYADNISTACSHSRKHSWNSALEEMKKWQGSHPQRKFCITSTCRSQQRNPFACVGTRYSCQILVCKGRKKRQNENKRIQNKRNKVQAEWKLVIQKDP